MNSEQDTSQKREQRERAEFHERETQLRHERDELTAEIEIELLKKQREAFGGKAFQLFIETLEADRDRAADELVQKLRWYRDDVDNVSKRMNEDANSALGLIDHLSQQMQMLDNQAGRLAAIDHQMRQARQWSLLLPDNDENPLNS